MLDLSALDVEGDVGDEDKGTGRAFSTLYDSGLLWASVGKGWRWRPVRRK